MTILVKFLTQRRFPNHLVRNLGCNRGNRTTIVSALIAMTLVVHHAHANSNKNESPQPLTEMTTDELNHRLVRVYDQVNSAVVRFEYRDDNLGGGSTGVIVSKDGHVLVAYVPPRSEKATYTVQLVDGRSIEASVLGWSQEFGVTMLKLNQSGPWPHVDLAQAENVTTGQSLVSLNHPTYRADVITRPLLSVHHAVASLPGWWFLSSEESHRWMRLGVAFDLNGRLVGLATFNPIGTAKQTGFTDGKLLKSIASDLIAGKNVDQERMNKQYQSGPAQVRSKADPNAIISQQATDNAVAASVRILAPSVPRMRVSGTIISKEGEIVTCAHHGYLPGTKVTVSLADGRDVEGVVISHGFPADIGMVKIAEPGEYPHVEFGDSTRIVSGDRCLLIGYGPVDKNDHRPAVRTISIVKSPFDRWSVALHSNAKMIGGDSGGGIFDENGRLIAINSGEGDRNADNSSSFAHNRVELFHNHWDDLHRPVEVVRSTELDRVRSVMQEIAHQARQSVVEILDGKNVVALGTVGTQDGRIWTKASVLPESPICRLSNGQTVPATVLKTIRKFDLAILKVDTAGLKVVRLTQQKGLPVGSLAAVVAEKDQPASAFVSHPPVSSPPEQGSLFAKLEDSPKGVVVTELRSFPEIPGYTLPPKQLQLGDVILSIDDHLTPRRESVEHLLYSDKSEPIAVAGDPVKITVERDNKQVTLRQILGQPTWPPVSGRSARKSNLGLVYNFSCDLNGELCGGPVLNEHGELLGILIAWQSLGWFNVLPSQVLELE